MDLLDQETISTLQEVLEDEFDTLIDTFLADAPLRIAEMKSVLAADNMEELERPAHTLKGSSGNVGALKLFKLCEVLVDQIRNNSVANATAQVDEIEAALQETAAAMGQFRSS